MAADELLYAIHLPRRFTQHRQYLRKVGHATRHGHLEGRARRYSSHEG